MNELLGPFCAHTGYRDPVEPSEDIEINQITLPSYSDPGFESHVALNTAEHVTSRSW